jgi:cell division protein FtsL
MSLVTSQHRARKAFIEIERQKSEMRQLEQQWSELQLEQTAAAKHGHIEKVARTLLGMQPVTPDRTQYIVKTPEIIR